METRGGHYEVVLEDRHLLGVFFAVVLLCAVFFTLGFVLGRSQGKSARAGSTPPAEPAKALETTAPPGPTAQDLSFYDRVEEKRPPVETLPPAKETRTAESPAAASKPPAPAPSKPPAKPAIEERASIYLQVAAFGQETEAKRLARELLQMGFPALVVPPKDDQFYRVQVGPFTNPELATAAKLRLEGQGYRPILRR